MRNKPIIALWQEPIVVLEFVRERFLLNSKNRVLFFIVVALFWFAQYVYIPFLTPYLLSINVGAVAVGFIVGAYGLTQMILRIPLGIFADYLQNHMLIIRIGVLFAAISSIGLMIFPSPILLFLASAVSGMASSAWISFTVMYSSFYREEEAAKAVGSIMMGNNIGILSAYIVGGLLYETTGIGPLFIASAVAGGLGLVLSFFIPNQAGVKAAVTVQGILSVAKDKRLWLFSIFASASNFITFATAVNFSQQMAKELGANGFSLGATSTLYTVGSLVGSVFVKRGLAERLGNKKSLLLGFGLLAIYCGCMWGNQSLWLIYPLQFLCGFSNGLIMSSMMTMIVKVASPQVKTTAMGFYQSVYSIGMTLGPIAMGALVSGFDNHLSPAFLVIGLVAVAVLPFALLAVKERLMVQ